MSLRPDFHLEEKDGKRGWYIGLKLSIPWERATAWLVARFKKRQPPPPPSKQP